MDSFHGGVSLTCFIYYERLCLTITGDVRNDIYVTIKQGEFTRGSKTADKNVEVTVLVCNKQGEPLKVCFH